MAKGVNATIAISQQTLDQRSEFGGDGGTNKKGVGTSQSILASIFPKSPIGTTADDLMYQGEASGLGSGIQRGASDIYEVYANVIDPENDGVKGFGFVGTEKAYLNYAHPNNPFVVGENIDFNSLTSGTPATENDNASSTRRYLGYPDLKVNSLDSPQDIAGSNTPSSEISLVDKNSNFGSEFSKDREKININPSSLLGRHTTSDNTTNIDSLGKYFKINYTEDTAES